MEPKGAPKSTKNQPPESLGAAWGLLGALGALLAALGALLGALGPLLGRPWGLLGPLETSVAERCGAKRAPLAILAAFLTPGGLILVTPRVDFRPSADQLACELETTCEWFASGLRLTFSKLARNA